MARLNGWYALNVCSILFLDSIIINWTSTIQCRCEIFQTTTNGTQRSMENVHLRLSASEHARINLETNKSAYEFASFHRTSHFDGWPFSFENNHNRFAISILLLLLLPPLLLFFCHHTFIGRISGMKRLNGYQNWMRTSRTTNTLCQNMIKCNVQ